jgi:PTH2 family peptidyl-tRNA hydrolase
MKQIMVVNEELPLPRGKLAAQVAHASIAAFLSASNEQRQEWLQNGMPKIVLKCSSEEALIELHGNAETNALPAYLVRDAGRTVVSEGTITCLGIGPADSAEIDKVTGDLKLL